ncbi:MAG: hypothetical protein EBU88_05470 [Acidobacteria bacterium]|nr:hypothetical protein [Acidobacteriota bacterium]
MVEYGQDILVRVRGLVMPVPALAWLMMIGLAALALSLTTLSVARSRHQAATLKRAGVTQMIEEARRINSETRRQTAVLRSESAASRVSAQQRLRLVGRNEVVIAVR